MTLLSKSESKFYINKGDDKDHVPTDEFLEKKHARFVVPEEALETGRKHSEMIKGLDRKRSLLPAQKQTSTNLSMLKRQSTLAIREA